MTKRDIEKGLKETLARNHVCYVLITCDAPSDSGEMHVNMTYEGDAALAAYLLHGAQSFMDEQGEEEDDAYVTRGEIRYFE